MSSRLKRWLFLIHRWLGIVACLFFAMWFISGVVMMYIGYPKLTERERLEHLPALDADYSYLTPRQALDKAGIDGNLGTLRLSSSRGAEPVYVVTSDKESGGGKRSRPSADATVINALTGERLSQVDSQLALRTAASFAGDGVSVAYQEMIGEDAFTHSRALDAHRPLHKVLLADQDKTLLYISGKTGEVVRDATQTERIWNYAGAWIHWLYPFRGNWFNVYWTDIVIWLSIGGVVLALTGTIIGIMRWRFKKPYRNGSRTPYQSGFMRWHHVFGLLFAAITITWIFSGLMSMNPWRIFDSGSPPLQVKNMNEGALTISDADRNPSVLIAAAGAQVKELRWARSLGQTIVIANGSAGRGITLNSFSGHPFAIDETSLVNAAAKLMPFAVSRVERLAQYDMYYYAREEQAMNGGVAKPLPILRVIFDDPHSTWVHIDPVTGAVLGSVDSYRRTSRWLFSMLHSWDWLPLLERRPLWDALLIFLSLGGAVLSITGIVIGWRRLGKKLKAASTNNN